MTTDLTIAKIKINALWAFLSLLTNLFILKLNEIKFDSISRKEN